MARPICWLHLSDLHNGCPGKELWEQVEVEFFRDLDLLLELLGPPDLLIFTGDLAFSGADREYREVDAFLDDLFAHLGRSGAPQPLLVSVPGNHDVAWPKGRAALLYRILRSFDGSADDPEVAEVSRELWRHRDASFIDGLFPGYRAWFDRRARLSNSSARRSHRPTNASRIPSSSARADLRRERFKLEPDLAKRALSLLALHGMSTARGNRPFSR